MLTVGPFALCGSWDTTPTPADHHRLILTPSLVASNGWSPWTQAGLRAVAQHVQPGMSVGDLGTGTGILAIAAALVGARPVWALDINPEALAVAAANIAANQVAVTLLEGSTLPEPVDLAIVSISTAWAETHGWTLPAGRLLVVHDDSTVEIVSGLQPPRHILE